VIFSVLAGGRLFGFLGVLLALPTASVVMVLIRHIHDLYKDSAFYGNAAGAAQFENADQPAARQFAGGDRSHERDA
jgi:hypothetical protein